MNIFKRLSLKYFNGSANLEVGEKRDILTDRGGNEEKFKQITEAYEKLMQL